LWQANPPCCQIELGHHVAAVNLGSQINIRLVADVDEIPTAPAVAEHKAQWSVGHQTNSGAPGVGRNLGLVVQATFSRSSQLCNERSGQKRVLAGYVAVGSCTDEG